MNITDSTAISFWHSLTHSHLRLAVQLTRLGKELEDNYSSNPNSKSIYRDLIKPYAIGGIMASVAFLECDINELFELIVDRPEDYKNISVED